MLLKDRLAQHIYKKQLTEALFYIKAKLHVTTFGFSLASYDT